MVRAFHISDLRHISKPFQIELLGLSRRQQRNIDPSRLRHVAALLRHHFPHRRVARAVALTAELTPVALARVPAPRIETSGAPASASWELERSTNLRQVIGSKF